MIKKQDILSSDFNDTEGWTLVNEFTIHTDHQLSDRPMMLTKVPKRLQLDLADIRAVDSYGCSADDWNDIEDGAPEYRHEPLISARADTEDKITIFSIEDGALLQFHEIMNVLIRPISVGKIGGETNATTLDGIGFSGMSSRDVPEKGLMDGEPGSLWLHTDPWPERGANEAPALHLNLYLDEPQFNDFFNSLLANSDKVEKATMATIVEMFETEVQASLNEPWMNSEYGLLQGDHKDLVSGRARIERISIGYSKPASVQYPAVQVDNDHAAPMLAMPDDRSVEMLRSVRARLGWVIGLLVVLILVLVSAA
ncbi:MAG: hypothetical protein OYH76_00445 [Defluviicoccus sp.]|nr:hypothetical protein [Defluviicoccus sp.]MDE0274332.1 hypothetical protein [Defluviicoccus sp.]